MTSIVEYKGGLEVVCTHLQSGTTMNNDAPVDNQGRGAYFSPTDTLATSLASCMLVTLGIKGNARGLDVGFPKATVTKIMSGAPRRVQEIQVVLTFDKEFSPEDREWLREVVHTCPVALSLHPELRQEITLLF
jgi:uncharacterized OsmC-like protein